MPISAALEIFETDQPITNHSTKFGGQPVWLDKPEWPLSSETGNPMMFIGQVALDQKIFPEAQGKMAYIFMTNEEEYVDGTWEPEGGENAIIIQPGIPQVPVKEQMIGPTLESEYGVSMTFIDVPNHIPEEERLKWEEAKRNEYYKRLGGNRVGGTPLFIQADEFPKGKGQDWQLLLQLDATAVPFQINFGDSGVGYAFINRKGDQGKFLFQCM